MVIHASLLCPLQAPAWFSSVWGLSTRGWEDLLAEAGSHARLIKKEPADFQVALAKLTSHLSSKFGVIPALITTLIASAQMSLTSQHTVGGGQFLKSERWRWGDLFQNPIRLERVIITQQRHVDICSHLWNCWRRQVLRWSADFLFKMFKTCNYTLFLLSSTEVMK